MTTVRDAKSPVRKRGFIALRSQDRGPQISPGTNRGGGHRLFVPVATRLEPRVLGARLHRVVPDVRGRQSDRT